MLLGHEKISFLHLPTPIERLDNLSAKLGINLYIKRDDLTPLAAGGNKLRKLEYFCAMRRRRGQPCCSPWAGHRQITAD